MARKTPASNGPVSWGRITQATGLFDTTSVFAGLVLLGVVGAIIDVALRHAEAWLLRWKGAN